LNVFRFDFFFDLWTLLGQIDFNFLVSVFFKVLLVVVEEFFLVLRKVDRDYGVFDGDESGDVGHDVLQELVEPLEQLLALSRDADLHVQRRQELPVDLVPLLVYLFHVHPVFRQDRDDESDDVETQRLSNPLP